MIFGVPWVEIARFSSSNFLDKFLLSITGDVWCQKLSLSITFSLNSTYYAVGSTGLSQKVEGGMPNSSHCRSSVESAFLLTMSFLKVFSHKFYTTLPKKITLDCQLFDGLIKLALLSFQPSSFFAIYLFLTFSSKTRLAFSMNSFRQFQIRYPLRVTTNSWGIPLFMKLILENTYIEKITVKLSLLS